jgi:hypothetical protein
VRATKLAKYPDPVHQLTDLCGGRVIAQTLEQVEAVRLFVERFQCSRISQLPALQSILGSSRPSSSARKFSSGLDSGDSAQGYWFDWILAKTLLNEAADASNSN